MALDPKARRWAVTYPKGRVTGCLGLLEYLFGTSDINTAPLVKTGLDGKRRLSNLRRRVTASGGKQIDIHTKDGKVYQLHYSGSLTDWVLGGVPKLDKTRVMAWSTKRGTMGYV
jgi:hypothetical protein